LPPIIKTEDKRKQQNITKQGRGRRKKKQGKERMSRTLFFVTGNANKLAEVSAILATSGISIQSKALDLPELQGTIEDVSKDKAKRAAEVVCVYSYILSTLLLLLLLPSSTTFTGGNSWWW